MPAAHLSLVRGAARRRRANSYLLPPFIAALFAAGRVIQRQPSSIRARQLLRARALVAAARRPGA